MKILHLEGDNRPDKLYSGALTDWIEEQNAEVMYIGNAYREGEKIAKYITWCDCLAFSSTFHYLDSIKALLTKVLIPLRKTPLQVVIMGYDVDKSITRLVNDLSQRYVSDFDSHGRDNGYFELDESKADIVAYSMRLFNLFELTGRLDQLRPITVLQDRINREQKRLNFEKEYSQTAVNRPTGRKIKIGDLKSVVGPQWSKLKEGQIVDEIDMSKLDPRPGWGIWVMGLSEPVKLIGRRDSRQYNEYEIITQ